MAPWDRAEGFALAPDSRAPRRGSGEGIEPARRGASLRAGLTFSNYGEGFILITRSFRVREVPLVDDGVTANRLRDAIKLAWRETRVTHPFECGVVERGVAA